MQNKAISYTPFPLYKEQLLIDFCENQNETSANSLIFDNLYLDYQDNDGDTALSIAAGYGLASTVKLLLQKKANPNLSNVYRVTALLKALHQKYFAIADLLLQYQADPNALDIYGNTPLFIAVKRQNLMSVYRLLEAGANCNLIDDNFKTPLMIAAELHNIGIYGLLADAGAIVTVPQRPIISTLEINYMQLFENNKQSKTLPTKSTDLLQ